MVTIKYKGETVNLKDIEINWIEYTANSENNFVRKVGNVEEYAQSKYKKGYKKDIMRDLKMGLMEGHIEKLKKHSFLIFHKFHL